MDEARRTGLWGEILAARYLRDHGYRILNTNFRVGHAEIDIIALDGAQVVVAEVKTRAPGGMLPAAEAVDLEKVYDVRQPIRYDIIELYYSSREDFTVHHIIDAF